MRNTSPDFPPDPAGHSVTGWLALFKAGQASALGPLWRRYYDRLAARADVKLPAGHIDGEDVAASAFGSFVFGVADQRFPKLDDRHDLWRVLASITDRKVIDERRRRSAVVHGGGLVAADPAALDSVPTAKQPPDVAAMLDEQFQRLLGLLDNKLRAIALYRLEGYTNAEIAGVLECSLRTVTLKLELIRKIWSAEGPP